MTDDTMNLQALVGKSADADFLREMIGFAAQRLMALEVGGLTGAGYREKSYDRLAQRNGYRERDWETWVVPMAQAAFDKPDRARQRRDQATDQRRRHLPQ
jgi:transposase-like protein